MSNETLAFNVWNVNAAPEAHGVYVLYNSTGIIYIGRASGLGVTIRSRLQAHIRGDEGYCTKQANAFWTEVNSDPVSREAWLLSNFRSQHGRLPRCNERVG